MAWGGGGGFGGRRGPLPVGCTAGMLSAASGGWGRRQRHSTSASDEPRPLIHGMRVAAARRVRRRLAASGAWAWASGIPLPHPMVGIHGMTPSGAVAGEGRSLAHGCGMPPPHPVGGGGGGGIPPPHPMSRRPLSMAWGGGGGFGGRRGAARLVAPADASAASGGWGRRRRHSDLRIRGAEAPYPWHGVAAAGSEAGEGRSRLVAPAACLRRIRWVGAAAAAFHLRIR